MSLDQMDQGEIGNTNIAISPIKKNRPSQSKHLFFTFNNYEQSDIDNLIKVFKDIYIEYIFQEEQGSNGTKHLQGYIHLITKSRGTDLGLPKQIHWEKVKNIKAAMNYCCKEDTRIGAVYRYPELVTTIQSLYDWQKQLRNLLLTKADDRTIYWIYEYKGNVGKSAFVKYMVINHHALFLDGGDKRDVCNLVFNSDMNKCNLVLFDLCRSKQSHISYSAIESIKNGLICNLKYETGFKAFNSPHIAIFSNGEPDYDQLSLDRWKVYFIDSSLKLQSRETSH